MSDAAGTIDVFEEALVIDDRAGFYMVPSTSIARARARLSGGPLTEALAGLVCLARESYAQHGASREDQQGCEANLDALATRILGVSRTTFAMARDHYLPSFLAAVHVRHRVPHHAELAVGSVVVVLVATLDLRGAIGFSSFGVLAYYAIANAAALTLTEAERRPARWVPVLGLLGCLVLAASLPVTSVLSGAGVLLLGALVFGLRRTAA